MEGSPAQPAGAEGRPDPGELLKSRSYVALLVLGGIVGAPIAAIAYFFLKAVAELQHYFYETLPGDLGFSTSRCGGRFRCWWSAGCWSGSPSAICPGPGGTSRPKG